MYMEFDQRFEILFEICFLFIDFKVFKNDVNLKIRYFLSNNFLFFKTLLNLDQLKSIIILKRYSVMISRI
jgi:hypothetical protein